MTIWFLRYSELIFARFATTGGNQIRKCDFRNGILCENNWRIGKGENDN